MVAQEGMTWRQWIISDFNTYPYDLEIDGNNCIVEEGETSPLRVWDEEESEYRIIDADESIINGGLYTFSS